MTGSRLLAAVDGFRSWRGSGRDWMEAVWRVAAISSGMLDDIFDDGWLGVAQMLAKVIREQE